MSRYATTNRRGQGRVEWTLLLVFVALLVHVTTSRTGLQIEMLFESNAKAIGVEFPQKGRSEVVSIEANADEGGIAASGRTIRKFGIVAE